jgi:hypothetical protein
LTVGRMGSSGCFVSRGSRRAAILAVGSRSTNETLFSSPKLAVRSFRAVQNIPAFPSLRPEE